MAATIFDSIWFWGTNKEFALWQMMKEWAAARQRVQEMKLTDAKAADKLNREITAR